MKTETVAKIFLVSVILAICLVAFSSAVKADSVTENNMRIREVSCTNFNINKSGFFGLGFGDMCFGVLNMNTTNNQDINVSAIFHSSTNGTVVAQYEWKNITHPTNTTWLEKSVNWTVYNATLGQNVTLWNYTKKGNYSDGYFYDWKPTKMYSLLNKSGSKSDAITIGKKEEKFFKFTIRRNDIRLMMSPLKIDIESVYNLVSSMVATLDPWMNSSFAYREKINITNVNGSVFDTSNNISIRLNLSTYSLMGAGKAQYDCGDMRFAQNYNNGTIYELAGIEGAYYIEYCGNTSAIPYSVVWIRPHTLGTGNNTFEMYYNATTPQTTTSNINATFIWADDLESGTGKWTWAGSMALTAGIYGNGITGAGYSFKNYIPAYETVVEAQINTSSPEYNFQLYDDAGNAVAIRISGGVFQYNVNGSGWQNSAIAGQTSVFNRQYIKVNGAVTRVLMQYENTSGLQTIYDADHTGLTNAYTRMYADNTDDKFDNVFIYRWIEPAFVYSVLPEEGMTTPDTTAPNITIVSPLNTSYSTKSLLVNISAVDDVNVSRIWYSNNSGVTNITYTTALNANFSEGSNTLFAWVNDTSGNINSTSVTFSIDSTAPTITINSPTNTTYAYADRYLMLNVTVFDLNNQSIWYNWNGTNYTYLNALNITFTTGSDTIYVYANDTLGNENVTSVTFTISAQPTTTVTLDGGGSSSTSDTTPCGSAIRYSPKIIYLNPQKLTETLTVWNDNPFIVSPYYKVQTMQSNYEDATPYVVLGGGGAIASGKSSLVTISLKDGYKFDQNRVAKMTVLLASCQPIEIAVNVQTTANTLSLFGDVGNIPTNSLTNKISNFLNTEVTQVGSVPVKMGHILLLGIVGVCAISLYGNDTRKKRSK